MAVIDYVGIPTIDSLCTNNVVDNCITNYELMTTIYIYIYICIYIYLCIYIYMCLCIYIYIHTHVYYCITNYELLNTEFNTDLCIEY